VEALNALPDTEEDRLCNAQRYQHSEARRDHLVQQVCVGALFQKRAKGHHIVGQRWIPDSVAWFSDEPLPKIRDGHRKPLVRCDATLGRARLRLAVTQLHHQPGRYPDCSWRIEPIGYRNKKN